MSAPRLRAAQKLARQLAARPQQRAFTSTNPRLQAETTETAVRATAEGAGVPQVSEGAAAVETKQAPNRADVWSTKQRPRTAAMTGPRFEQTNYELQPQPYSAMELIHQQPVRWTHKRMVACDGGGGPAGHPRIFINTDKPEISVCNYCGLPFANEHHREHLESLPATSYPLS